MSAVTSAVMSAVMSAVVMCEVMLALGIPAGLLEMTAAAMGTLPRAIKSEAIRRV